MQGIFYVLYLLIKEIEHIKYNMFLFIHLFLGPFQSSLIG